MKFTTTAMAALLAGAAFTTAAANAQGNYGAQAAPQQSAAPEQGQQGQATAAAAQPKISRKAVKAIQDLQATVKAGNFAEVPAKVAAADAVASTADDRYMIGVFRYQAAVTSKDDAARAAAIEAMIASGFEGAPRGDLYADLGATYVRLKQTDRAQAAFQQALQLNPNNVDVTAGLAELRVEQGQPGEALALLRKGIALQAASGGRPSEAWFKRAVAIAYKAKLPQAVQVSRDWVQAYPTKTNWSDAIAIYQNLGQLDEAQMLDLLRLKRVAGTLSQGDYFTFGDVAVRKGLAGEAKAVLEEGFAANAISRSDPSFSQLYALASQRTKGDRESLPSAPSAGAPALQTVKTGDAYFGYGDYSKAVEFYRAALAKPDADKNLVNLHLGMALARQGDKAGAAAALSAVGGPQAEIAKYWLLYAGA